MAYWIDTSDNGRLQSSDRQIPFWADTTDDVANLPTTTTLGVQQGEDTTSCQLVGKGSTCTVIGDGRGSLLYVLNSQDQWIRM